MTQAFNLSQLANNINSSGQLDATDGLTGAVPVANGGTGLTSVGTSGNVLTSNGSAWVSQAISAGGNYIQRTYTSPATWTNPTNLKAVKVTLVGGGGGCGASSATSGGTSSFGSFVSASGGGGGVAGSSSNGGGGGYSNGDYGINGQGGDAEGYSYLSNIYTKTVTASGPDWSVRNGNNYGVGGNLSFSAGYASGGGGGYAVKYVTAPAITTPQTVTVGSGGIGNATNPPSLRASGSAGIVIVEEFY